MNRKIIRLESVDLDGAIADAPLRYTYVREVWPEADGDTYSQAAAADVVIRALSIEVRRMQDVANEARQRADRAERAVAHFRDAARTIVEMTEPADATLFDAVAS